MWFDILKNKQNKKTIPYFTTQHGYYDGNDDWWKWKQKHQRGVGPGIYHPPTNVERQDKFEKIDKFVDILVDALENPNKERDFDIDNPVTWKKPAESLGVNLDDEEIQEYIMTSLAAKGFE